MTSYSRTVLAFGLVCLAAIAVPAKAEIYQWVDEQGKIHFSDQPPLDSTNVKKLTRKSTSATGPATSAAPGANRSAVTPTAPKNYVDKELDYKRRKIEAEEQEKKDVAKATEDKKMKEYCASLKADKAMYEAGGRIARTTEKGERALLTDKEIKAELARTKQDLKKACPG